MNPIAAVPWETPTQPRTQAFVAALEHGGAKVTVRKRKGADIDAACGQLRLAELQPATTYNRL
jgi:23S rRNA (adenine2503-C2)-methyltransferase